MLTFNFPILLGKFKVLFSFFLILSFFSLTLGNVGVVLKDIHLDRSCCDIWPVQGNICGATGRKDTAIKFLIKMKTNTESWRNKNMKEMSRGRAEKAEVKKKETKRWEKRKEKGKIELKAVIKKKKRTEEEGNEKKRKEGKR